MSPKAMHFYVTEQSTLILFGYIFHLLYLGENEQVTCRFSFIWILKKKNLFWL